MHEEGLAAFPVGQVGFAPGPEGPFQWFSPDKLPQASEAIEARSAHFYDLDTKEMRELPNDVWAVPGRGLWISEEESKRLIAAGMVGRVDRRGL